MLAQSNLPSGNSLKFFGGTGIGSLVENNQRTNWSINNAMCFGENVSWPQGCNDVNCTKMQLENTTEFGNIAVRFFGEGSTSLSLEALGEMSVTMEGVGTFAPNAELGLESDVLMQGVGTFTADLEALGEMSVLMDAGAKPSAYDIAQEIWQSPKAAYNAPGTMGNAVNSAGSAGDPWGTDVSTYPPGTAGNLLYTMDAQALADAIMNDARLLTVAKFLGLK